MKILFDALGSQVQVHEFEHRRLSTLFGAIKGEGWTHTLSSDPITAAQLSGIDVLAILTRHKVSVGPVAPSYAYSASEKTAITSFVHNGGGLLLLSNHGKTATNNTDWTENDKALASQLGVTITPAFFTSSGTLPLSGGDLNTSLSLLSGVGEILVHNSSGISCAGTFQSIARIPSTVNDSGIGHVSNVNQHYALTLNHGSGRVIVGGNSGLSGDDGTSNPAAGLIPFANNLLFLINCLKYLAKLI